MDRREFLMVGAGAVAGVVAGGAAALAGSEAQPAAVGEAGKAGGAQGVAAFTAALSRCLETGNACMDHCLRLLAAGDKTLGECARAVHEMLAVCQATAALAPTDSRHRKTVIALCRDVCADCEKACRKHEDHHAECKACADACAATQREAVRLLA